MDNLKSPAYPHQTWEEVAMNRGENQIAHSTNEKLSGFTKLEKAALMIAQGMAANPTSAHIPTTSMAILSAELAKAVLQECNK